MQMGGFSGFGQLQQTLQQSRQQQDKSQQFIKQLKGSRDVFEDVAGITEQSDGTTVDEGDKALKKAAEGLEGLFINLLVKQMRKTVPENKLLDGGHGGKMFREKLDQKYSNMIAKEKDFGIASTIQDQLTGQIAPAE